MPECIYPYLDSLAFFRARNVIIRGNASIANGDPLLRLPPTIDKFMIRHPTTLLNPTKNYSGSKHPYAMDWTKFFNRFPLLDQLEIGGAQMTGTLPSSLPSILSRFEVPKNSFSGTIPAGLLSNLAFSSPVVLDLQSDGTSPSSISAGTYPTPSAIDYDLSDNKLTGTIPASLFEPLVGHTRYGTVRFSAASNELAGTIPDFWTNTVLNEPSMINLDFSDNNLEGTLPSYMNSLAVSSYTLNLSSNKLTGTVPHTLLESSSIFSSYYLFLDNNQLSGALPSNLSMGSLCSITVSLASNKITGTLPSAFFSKPQQKLALDLSRNDLTGSIPSDFLYAHTDLGDPIWATLSLSYCGLSGSIPASIRGNIRFANFDFSYNDLSGTIPSIMTVSAPSNTLTLNAAHNKLTGRLSFPSLTDAFYFHVNVSHNELTELVFESDEVKYITSLDVSYNKNLTGNFSIGLFDTESYLEVLNASHTSLSVEFPDLSRHSLVQRLHSLNLSSTNIDFCAGGSLWSVPTLVSCDLGYVNASKTCISAYPALCTSIEGVNDPLSAPSQPQGLLGTILANIVIVLVAFVKRCL